MTIYRHNTWGHCSLLPCVSVVLIQKDAKSAYRSRESESEESEEEVRRDRDRGKGRRGNSMKESLEMKTSCEHPHCSHDPHCSHGFCYPRYVRKAALGAMAALTVARY